MEIVGHLMVAATIILLSNVMMTNKQYYWAPFLIVLTLILTDDIFQFHELLGMQFEQKYGLDNYIAEFLGFMCLGVVGMIGWVIFLSQKQGILETIFYIFRLSWISGNDWRRTGRL